MKVIFPLFFLFFAFSASLSAQSWKSDFQKADSLMKIRDFKNSIPLYQNALSLADKEVGKKNEDYLNIRNGLGRSMTYVSPKAETRTFLSETLNLCKEFGEKTALYAQAMHNAGTFYLPFVQGNNPENAEFYLKKALSLRKEIIGEKHPDYAASLNNLAILYRDMGNYPAAELLCKESLKLRKEILGDKHPDYAISLNNLAVLYQVMRNYPASEPLYKESLKLRKEILGDKHPDYADLLNNLGILYTKMGNYSVAESLYKESLNLKKEILGEKHPEYANSLNNLGALYLDIGNYPIAESLYKESLNLKKEIKGEKHPDYILSLNNIAKLFWQKGDKKTAFEKKSIIKNWCIEQTQTQFPHLSEAQREAFFDIKIKSYLSSYNSYTLEMPEINTSELYNLQLSAKAILMQASQKMKNRILNSGDSLLVKKYSIWSNLKTQIIKAEEMSEKLRIEKGIKLDSLKEENENLEKELSAKSQSFASLNDKKQISWKDIQKKLKKDEAAIEIVRVNKFGVREIITDSSDVAKAPNFPKYPLYDLTDTVYYAALIIKKKSKAPEIVLLKNGNDLEKKYAFYQKNAVFYKREDALSYNQFWKPIAEKLTKIKKVYFSPDGVYNQIAVNTLQNPETKKYVLDEIELHLLTNTKDLLAFGKSENKNFKAELLGYPIYDLQTQNDNEARKRALEADTTRAFANFQKVSLLPGTKKEIEDVSLILKEKKYTTEILTEKTATEENIKKVKNPKILHFSTHGFFIDSKEKNEKINPMLRSGLLLTGVSDYTRAEIKPETEDGILTALEAANLDLDETDLVVLSACETGLGDIKAGEGVYGLQRAFRVAGAKTLVMSLWKVDDAVTQKLMTTFYRKFAEYNNARKAFKEAQADIKKQYPEPYFWGAFVMSGE